MEYIGNPRRHHSISPERYRGPILTCLVVPNQPQLLLVGGACPWRPGFGMAAQASEGFWPEIQSTFSSANPKFCIKYDIEKSPMLVLS